MENLISASKTLKRLIKISRFPHFWFWSVGVLSWGALFAAGKDAFSSQSFWVLFFWFIFPANLFLNAINDAFDYETDVNNPRKQSLESTVPKDGTRKMLRISFFALASVIVISPFVSLLVMQLILMWAMIIFVYNVPPIRLKQYPLLDVLFGGVGHFVTIGVIGYAAVSGNLPSLSLVLLGVLFCAAQHILCASWDATYDLRAGIKNTTARLGTTQKGLVVSMVLFILSAIYGFFINLPLFSFWVLILPIFILHIIFKDDLEVRSVSIFKKFFWVLFVFGIITGTFLYWS